MVSVDNSSPLKIVLSANATVPVVVEIVALSCFVSKSMFTIAGKLT